MQKQTFDHRKTQCPVCQ